MSRDIWFISDTHFFHANSLAWESGERSHFSSVEEMNETMIENWNKVVRPGDLVYHLGDVFLGPSTHDQRAKLMSRLKGSKRLVVGNHDDVKYLSSGGFFKKTMLWRVWDDKPIIFSHVPIHESSLGQRGKFANRINVHGHTHAKGSPSGPYRSVCVELNNFTPVHLEDLL